MCFSAAGSFALSGALGGVGAASLALNRSARLRLFAAIPLIFAVQQAAEGTVWVTIGEPAHAALHRVAVSVFLGIAVVVWPIWCPFSLRLAERSAARRRVLTALSWIGAVVSVGALVLLILWRPVAAIAGHSVRYDHARSNVPWLGLCTLSVFVVPAIVPYFVSTTKLARTIGATLVVSLAVTFLVERETFTSVWCFFAAVLSVLVLVAVSGRPRNITGVVPIGAETVAG